MLFLNGEAVKTIDLEGTLPLVKFINGLYHQRIVTVAKGGKLTVLNRNLDIIKSFSGTDSFVSALTGNVKFIAHGDSSGAVRYYNRGTNLQKVRDFFDYRKLLTGLPSWRPRFFNGH